MSRDKRPKLNKSISINDFTNFYWLKKELVIFCRDRGISVYGGKVEIENRIVEYLETGKIPIVNVVKKIIS